MPKVKTHRQLQLAKQIGPFSLFNNDIVALKDYHGRGLSQPWLFGLLCTLLIESKGKITADDIEVMYHGTNKCGKKWLAQSIIKLNDRVSEHHDEDDYWCSH